MSDLPAGPDDEDRDSLPSWDAIEELFLANRTAAASGAALILRSPHDVEEVLQDSFIEAATMFHTLKDPRAANGWFRTIVARKAFDLVKKRKRSYPAGSAGQLEEVWQVASPYLPAEWQAQVNEAMKFIDSLPDKQRHAYLLRHYFGLKLREIAAALDCAEKTVTSHLRKAQDKVDKHFQEKERPAISEIPARLRGGKS